VLAVVAVVLERKVAHKVQAAPVVAVRVDQQELHMSVCLVQPTRAVGVVAGLT